MSKAWNGWYHVNGNTYGTWLRGDPRGWRTRHHREHVDGDYKSPPEPGTFEEIHARSRRLMKRRAVHLDKLQRRIAGQAMVERLVASGVELLVLSQDASHYHLLARFPNDQVRQSVGKAKKHASHVLSQYGLKGTVWARKCRALPIANRKHQVSAFSYIENHGEKGAWVWTFRQGLYWLSDEGEAHTSPPRASSESTGPLSTRR